VCTCTVSFIDCCLLSGETMEYVVFRIGTFIYLLFLLAICFTSLPV